MAPYLQAPVSLSSQVIFSRTKPEDRQLSTRKPSRGDCLLMYPQFPLGCHVVGKRSHLEVNLCEIRAKEKKRREKRLFWGVQSKIITITDSVGH